MLELMEEPELSGKSKMPLRRCSVTKVAIPGEVQKATARTTASVLLHSLKLLQVPLIGELQPGAVQKKGLWETNLPGVDGNGSGDKLTTNSPTHCP